jgi:hypothetical protein
MKLTQTGPFFVEQATIPEYSFRSLGANGEKPLLLKPAIQPWCALSVDDSSVLFLDAGNRVAFTNNRGLRHNYDTGSRMYSDPCPRMIHAVHLDVPYTTLRNALPPPGSSGQDHYYLSRMQNGTFCSFNSITFLFDYPAVEKEAFSPCSGLSNDNSGTKALGNSDPTNSVIPDGYYLFAMPDGSGRPCAMQLPHWSNRKTTLVRKGEYPPCFDEKKNNGWQRMQQRRSELTAPVGANATRPVQAWAAGMPYTLNLG